MAKIFIETERLILREIVASDVQRMFLLDSNQDVMKYLGAKTLTTPHESLQTIEKIRKQYRETGIGRWAVIEKKSDLLIGWSGLKLLTESVNNFKNVYEIGYRFLPESWGKGYATEAGKAVLEYGFAQMNLDKIYACAVIENQGSNVILKDKLGFAEMGTFIDAVDGAECFWYELSRENYRKN